GQTRGFVFKAPDPDAVADHQMIEGAVDRSKKSLAVLLARGIVETRGRIVELGVHPGAVMRHQAGVGRGHSRVSWLNIITLTKAARHGRACPGHDEGVMQRRSFDGFRRMTQRRRFSMKTLIGAAL